MITIAELQQSFTQLTAPLKNHEVEWRVDGYPKGGQARVVPYVITEVVFDRLNSHIGFGNWSIETIRRDDVVVKQVTYQGMHKINRNESAQAEIVETTTDCDTIVNIIVHTEEGDRVFSGMANDLDSGGRKGSETRATCRAASRIGIGSELYLCPKNIKAPVNDYGQITQQPDWENIYTREMESRGAKADSPDEPDTPQQRGRPAKTKPAEPKAPPTPAPEKTLDKVDKKLMLDIIKTSDELWGDNASENRHQTVAFLTGMRTENCNELHLDEGILYLQMLRADIAGRQLYGEDEWIKSARAQRIEDISDKRTANLYKVTSINQVNELLRELSHELAVLIEEEAQARDKEDMIMTEKKG